MRWRGKLGRAAQKRGSARARIWKCVHKFCFAWVYPVIPSPRRGRENPLIRSPNRKKTLPRHSEPPQGARESPYKKSKPRKTAVMLRHARSARLSMTIEKRAHFPLPCLNKRAKSRLFSRLFSRHSVPTLWLEAISQAAFLK